MADTLEVLAAQISINAEARIGQPTTTRAREDLDFHRGETVFDRYYGDDA